MAATANHLLTERMERLNKTATDMAQIAITDFEKALPANDREKGLELFNIVNESMKKQRRGKKRRTATTKPKPKISKRGVHKRKHNNAVNRRLNLTK